MYLSGFADCIYEIFCQDFFASCLKVLAPKPKEYLQKIMTKETSLVGIFGPLDCSFDKRVEILVPNSETLWLRLL